MEVDERRTPEHELGERIGAGRDAVIHALGPDRVLRRTPDERDHRREAAVMVHARAAGYPVPEVFRVGPGELVLARIEGPTMLEDLGRRPWRVDRHARTLADLHRELHAIAPPDGLPHHRLDGPSILHQDLHPGNVLLSPTGPVVIDWTNACVGDAAADVALTWILMASFEVDPSPPAGGVLGRLAARAEGAITPWLRRRLVDGFLAASGIEDRARSALGPTAEQRLEDRGVRPGEAVAIRAMVAREDARRRSGGDGTVGRRRPTRRTRSSR